jgi:hypothetical protein
VGVTRVNSEIQIQVGNLQSFNFPKYSFENISGQIVSPTPEFSNLDSHYDSFKLIFKFKNIILFNLPRCISVSAALRKAARRFLAQAHGISRVSPIFPPEFPKVGRQTSTLMGILIASVAGMRTAQVIVIQRRSSPMKSIPTSRPGRKLGEIRLSKLQFELVEGSNSNSQMNVIV